jgi:TonB family protein
VTRPRPKSRLVRAAGLSLVGHAALFALLAGHAAPALPPLADNDGWSLLADAQAAAASPTWVDLRAATEALPQPEPTPPPLAGDEAHNPAVETSPRLGNSEARQMAAADSGSHGGQQLPVAFRRDRSTLHTRLADNAATSAMEHERTAGRAASPQAIRQEPRVGVGDSSRTRRPRPGDALASSEGPRADEDGAFPSQVTRQPVGSEPSDTGQADVRGEGPLDAEAGRRRFDVEREGAAQDDHSARAASNETHQGRFELSAPSAPGAGAAGQGPGEAPGAVSRPSSGSGPATYGAPREAARGALAMSAAEREYQRSLAEIRRRVISRLRFPRRLALELEQGEAVVHFVVRPDGRIDGAVHIVKSAGFDEFDAEAVSAVTRAAPFPPMTRTLSFSMQIGFDNPLVR